MRVRTKVRRKLSESENENQHEKESARECMRVRVKMNMKVSVRRSVKVRLKAIVRLRLRECAAVSRGEPGTPLLKSRDGHLEGGDFLQAKMASSSPRLFPAPNPKEHPKNKFGEQKSV